MKKFFASTAVILTLTLTMAACGSDTLVDKMQENNQQLLDEVTSNFTQQEPTTEATQEDVTEPTVTVSEDDMAIECLLAVVHADSADAMLPHLTEDSAARAEGILEYYQGDTYDATAKKLGSFEDLLVFRYTLTSKTDPSKQESDVILCLPGDDGFRMCLGEEVISRFREQNLCGTCSGNGTIYTGGNTCGICGGTGQQYIANAYFDAALNMWMGQWQTCSGCGGAGHTGGNTVTCSNCGGLGLDIH